MKITVLRKMGYEGTFIYIMQFEYAFQYLFSWEGEVFQQHAFIKPPLYRRVMWRLGLLKSPYTVHILNQGEQALLSGAMASIDALKRPGAKAKRKKAQEQAKSRNSDCMWQTLLFNDKKTKVEHPYYFCITHKQTAPFEEGKIPSHVIKKKVIMTTSNTATGVEKH